MTIGTGTAPEKNSEKSLKQSANLSIPIRSIWSTVGVILFGYFTYLQMIWYILPNFQVIYTFNANDIVSKNIGYIWAPIIGYILYTILVCLFVSIIKPLKGPGDTGLLFFFCLFFVISICINALMIMLGILLPTILAHDIGTRMISIIVTMMIIATLVGFIYEIQKS